MYRLHSAHQPARLWLWPHAAPVVRARLCDDVCMHVCHFCLTGAVVFTFDNARALEDAVLMPQPRAAVHDALLHPSRYLGPHCIDE